MRSDGLYVAPEPKWVWHPCPRTYRNTSQPPNVFTPSFQKTMVKTVFYKQIQWRILHTCNKIKRNISVFRETIKPKNNIHFQIRSIFTDKKNLLSVPGALSHLDEDGEEHDGDDGGEEEGLHGVVGQQEAQGVCDGASQAAVRHDELVLLRQLDDAELINYIREANHSWNRRYGKSGEKMSELIHIKKRSRGLTPQKISFNFYFLNFLSMGLWYWKPLTVSPSLIRTFILETPNCLRLLC